MITNLLGDFLGISVFLLGVFRGVPVFLGLVRGIPENS
jgi:hypothetical protein